MMPYYEADGITIYCGDCREVMPQLGEPCDFVLTDPPYGLEFMGKDWDKGIPGPRFWHEVLRVAKPGAHLLAFGGTRTHHRLMCAIEDAGWEIRDTLMWVYGSGFPKSLDVSKAIDKAAGVEREVVGRYELPDVADGLRHKGWECTNTTEVGVFGVSGQSTITAPATDGAKLWHGWGTALKPAWEPIILAMKPLDGTFAENAMRHGVAGLAIDKARIPTNGEQGVRVHNGKVYEGVAEGYQRPNKSKYMTKTDWYMVASGRFPANVIHDGSEEVMGLFLETTSGARKGGEPYKRGRFEGQKGALGLKVGTSCEGSHGSAARFFKACPYGDEDFEAVRTIYCPKASRAERDMGLEDMPLVEFQTGCGGDFPTDDQGRDRDRFKVKAHNSHPCIKPLALLRYLLTLLSTPTGGLVLDPFLGSGSTLVAAKQLGRRAIGIEISEEYCQIAARRVQAATYQAIQQPLPLGDELTYE